MVNGQAYSGGAAVDFNKAITKHSLTLIAIHDMNEWTTLFEEKNLSTTWSLL
jgi:hypothetical protein